MKQIYILLFSAFTLLGAQAQTNVYLKINHLLNGQALAFNTTATNNLNNEFKVTRLEYYISQVNIIHDGGQVTPATTQYLLVDASNPINEMLGNLNITSIEGIQLSIGVESPTNNADPSVHPAGHPLAPKMPSMHWGWAGGYRFVAMEGTSGNGFSQIFEFHALGNGNYHTFTVNTAGSSIGNDLIIELDANMDMALKNIDVSSGSIIHGEVGNAATLLVNFNRDVFVSSEGNTSISITENIDVNEVVFYPNPSNGHVELKLNSQQEGALTFEVKDITGKSIDAQSAKGAFDFETNGIYFISIYSDRNYVGTKKVVITD
jgi:hypothetical protein